MPEQFNDPAQIMLQQQMLESIQRLNTSMDNNQTSSNVVKPKGDGSTSMVNVPFEQVMIVDERGDRSKFMDLLEDISKSVEVQSKTISTMNKNEKIKTNLQETNNLNQKDTSDNVARFTEEQKKDSQRANKFRREELNVFERMVLHQSEGTNGLLSLPKAIGGKFKDSITVGLRESTLGKLAQAFGLFQGEARENAKERTAALKDQKDNESDKKEVRQQEKKFYAAGLRKGSLQVHDIHTEELLEKLVGSFTPEEREKNAKLQGATMGKLLKEGEERNALFSSLSDPRTSKALKVTSPGFDRLARKMSDMRMGKDKDKGGGWLSSIISILALLGLGAGVAGLAGFGNLFKLIFKWLPKLASTTGLLSKAGKFLGLGKIAATAGKVVSKLPLVGKLIGKTSGKLLGKTLAKKIPGVGLVIGAGLAASRAISGDYIGAVGELASGVASLVPGIGTAVSFGIDGLLALKDNWTGMGDTFKGIMDDLPDTANKALDAAKDAGSNILAAGKHVGGKLVSGVTGLASSISDWWNSSDNAIADTVTKGATAVATAGVTAGKFLASKGKGLLQGALSTGTSIASAIGKKALTVGSGISSVLSTVGGAALNVGGQAIDFVKDNAAGFLPMTTRQQTDVLVSEIRMLRTALETIFKTTTLEAETARNMMNDGRFAAAESAGPLSNPSTFYSAAPIGHTQTQMVIRS